MSDDAPIWPFVLGGIGMFLLISMSYAHYMLRPFTWSERTRCSVSGKIFFAVSFEVCPCHGEKRERVIARWRRKWQIKNEATDAELEELRRLD